MTSVSLKRANLNDVEQVLKIERTAKARTYYALTKKDDVISYITDDNVFLILNKNVVVYRFSGNRTKW